MERVCDKCGKTDEYRFLKVYRTNMIYVGKDGRRWKNSKTCPECFSKYNTDKTKNRRLKKQSC